MTISTAIVISAFFLALSPALYKLAELASEWCKLRRTIIEIRIDGVNAAISNLESMAKQAFREVNARFEEHGQRNRDLEERLIKLNNRVVAGGRKVS